MDRYIGDEDCEILYNYLDFLLYSALVTPTKNTKSYAAI